MQARLRGYRKMVVLAACLGSLLGGVAMVRGDANAVGIITPFCAAVVAIGGWFFKANADVHKIQGGGAQ